MENGGETKILLGMVSSRRLPLARHGTFREYMGRNMIRIPVEGGLMENVRKNIRL